MVDKKNYAKNQNSPEKKPKIARRVLPLRLSVSNQQRHSINPLNPGALYFRDYNPGLPGTATTGK